MAARSQHVGGANPEFVLRAFEGVNTLMSRDLINDDEFYWLENAIPVAAGSLYPVNSPSSQLQVAGETGSPSYAQTFTVGVVDYIFAVWAGSGHGYIINLSALTSLQIITGLTSGQTTATSYNNQGLLILDPTGYWDWNVTTPNTLTPQNNTVTSLKQVTNNSIGGGTQLKQILSVSGTGASFQTTYQVISLTIFNAGTSYVVGDVLSLTDGSPIAPAQITVASVGGGGTVTGIAGLIGGSYPGPTSTTLVPVGPTGSVVSGGTGSGATFHVTIQVLKATVLVNGSGYSNSDTLTDETSVPNIISVFNLVTSGVIGGIAIATYAARVWLASGRVVNFTDVNSYNSFGGAGGSFTISDSYLHIAISALCAANNYLYIFSDSSVDALSNVTVLSGVTSFSRINITSSVGTNSPTSVFPYFRSIAFWHESGFYLLSGATPEKFSEKINSVVTAISITVPVFGGQVIVQGEICAAFLFTFTDSFTQNSVQRTLIALFFRSRWWFASAGFNGPALASMCSVAASGPSNTVANRGIWTLYAWEGNTLYKLFDVTKPLMTWQAKTKLWDAGAAFKEKQAINSAVAGLFTTTGTSGVTIQVDTENGNSGAIATALVDDLAYDLLVQKGNEGGSQYLGLTIVGSANNMSRVEAIALRGKADRDMLT